MIFINNNNAIGSKTFTHELAVFIRPILTHRLTLDDIDDFDLYLLQDMVHFGDLSANDFNFLLDVIKHGQNIDNVWQKVLIEYMQVDPRYQPSPQND